MNIHVPNNTDTQEAKTARNSGNLKKQLQCLQIR